jgi:hypothetical protein
MLDDIKEYLSLNLSDYENIDVNFEINKFILICAVALCFVAFIINTLICITVGEVANMFFVGPFPSPIIVFSEISRRFGWTASTVIYIPLISLAAGVIFGLNAKCKA